MNTDLETIENYLTGQLPPNERAQFEDALRTDPALAESLAFYLMTKQAVREERRAELDALRNQTERVHPLWSAPMRWVAAASVVLFLGVGWYFFQLSDSANTASQLADAYISRHFESLQTTMDAGPSGSRTTDSLRTGIDRFNQNQLAEADAIFEDVLKRQPTNDSALKYAGIVALRQGNYDQAITLFHHLSQQTDLFANPGTFYEALAHLKRGQPADQIQAKELLDEVVRKNLEGKKEAQRLLEAL
ncbi:tetratricopeptide repeat protein [Spirosoma koreense]